MAAGTTGPSGKVTVICDFSVAVGYFEFKIVGMLPSAAFMLPKKWFACAGSVVGNVPKSPVAKVSEATVGAAAGGLTVIWFNAGSFWHAEKASATKANK